MKAWLRENKKAGTALRWRCASGWSGPGRVAAGSDRRRSARAHPTLLAALITIIFLLNELHFWWLQHAQTLIKLCTYVWPGEKSLILVFLKMGVVSTKLNGFPVMQHLIFQYRKLL